MAVKTFYDQVDPLCVCACASGVRVCMHVPVCVSACALCSCVRLNLICRSINDMIDSVYAYNIVHELSNGQIKKFDTADNTIRSS